MRTRHQVLFGISKTRTLDAGSRNLDTENDHRPLHGMAAPVRSPRNPHGALTSVARDREGSAGGCRFIPAGVSAGKQSEKPSNGQSIVETDRRSEVMHTITFERGYHSILTHEREVDRGCM